MQKGSLRQYNILFTFIIVIKKTSTSTKTLEMKRGMIFVHNCVKCFVFYIGFIHIF